MNKNLKKGLLVLAAVSSTASATEWRTPWLSEMGPIRYTFDRLHEDKSNLNMWTAMHMKEAHKAFLKNSFDSTELSTLIFNQPSFSINQALPTFAAAVPPLTAPITAANYQAYYQNYNPLVTAKILTPRVAYTEYGVDWGFRWDFPVWGNKGRIGLRAYVPFRRIEMERLDSGLDAAENPTADFVATKQIAVNLTSAGAPGVVAQVNVSAYRMDALNALNLLDGSSTTGVQMFGSQIGAANAATAPAAIALTNSMNTPFVDAFQLSDGLGAPGTINQVAANIPNSSFVAGSIVAQNPDYATNLPTAITVDFFDTADDYSATFQSAGFAANSATTWLVFRRQTDSPDPSRFGAGVANASGVGGLISRQIDATFAAASGQNAFAYLSDQNFSLDSQVRSGIGDCDLDVFFEYMFNKDWVGEIGLGVRIPTGGSDDQYSSPYRLQLGNGDHWEIDIKGLLAWQLAKWINIKLDAKFSFVLENTEHRIAAFQGATIKNFGPRADADVDWSYFVGHFDFNFFHPKTSDIRSTLGYEFYYKTKDHVHYKQSAINSFLGNLIGGTTGTFKLSNSLAEQNTESMAHKVRGETSFQINPYFEIFAGASATFAGQNVMKDSDLHGGFNIRF